MYLFWLRWVFGAAGGAVASVAEPRLPTVVASLLEGHRL